jgi:hypothetical protein
MMEKQTGLATLSIMQQHGIQFPKKKEIQLTRFPVVLHNQGKQNHLGHRGNASHHQPQVYNRKDRLALHTILFMGCFLRRGPYLFFWQVL